MYDTSPRKILGYQASSPSRRAAGLLARPGHGRRRSCSRSSLGRAGVGGWFAPIYYINIKKRQRFTEIDKQMPDMIDLLVVTIEAGLGILASMRVASETMSDPLGQELRLTLQEQRMGLTVQQAIESLGERADAPNMRIFVRSLTQGERLGVSIAATMRNLSLEMRKRRKAAAEERAQKMPIKMLFPLIFFIFPAMFIVLLVPMASTSSTRWASDMADLTLRREDGRIVCERVMVSDRRTGGCAGCSGAAPPGGRAWSSGPAGASTPPSCASRSTRCSSTRTRSS